MRWFGYYVIHTLINGIKKLFRTWVAVMLGFFVLCGVLGGVIGVAIGSTVEDMGFDSSYEDTEELTEEDLEMTPEEQRQLLEWVELIAGGVILLVLLVNVYNSDKSGTNIFTMADVNFLFTAPLRPQSVLLFRVLMQMGGTLLASVYLLFQIPNLVLNLGLSLPMVLAIFACWILTLVLGKVLAVLVYTLIATHEKLRKFVRMGVFGLVAALALAVYAVMQGEALTLPAAVMWLFGGPASRLVPGWGWLKGLVGYAIDGSLPGVLLCVAATLLLIAALVFFTWRVRADFYEDALAHAAQVQEAAAAAAEGRGAKRTKERPDRLRRDGLWGQGASLFLVRGVYNRHRFARFGLFTGTGVTYLCIFTLMTAAIRLLSDSNRAETSGMLVLPAAVVAFIAFFRNLGNPLEEDLRGHLLFLVPESPGKKLLYALLAGGYDTLMDVAPGLVVATVLLRASWLQAAGWLVLIVAMDFMVSVTGLLLQLGLPSSLPAQVHTLLQLMLKMLLLLIPLILLLVVGLTVGMTVALPVAAALCVVMGAVCFLPARVMLHGGKN